MSETNDPVFLHHFFGLDDYADDTTLAALRAVLLDVMTALREEDRR